MKRNRTTKQVGSIETEYASDARQEVTGSHSETIVIKDTTNTVRTASTTSDYEANIEIVTVTREYDTVQGADSIITVLAKETTEIKRIGATHRQAGSTQSATASAKEAEENRSGELSANHSLEESASSRADIQSAETVSEKKKRANVLVWLLAAIIAVAAVVLTIMKKRFKILF